MRAARAAAWWRAWRRADLVGSAGAGQSGCGVGAEAVGEDEGVEAAQGLVLGAGGAGLGEEVPLAAGPIQLLDGGGAPHVDAVELVSADGALAGDADITRAVGLLGIEHAAVSGCLQRAKGACPFLDDIFASHLVHFSVRINVIYTNEMYTVIVTAYPT